MDINKANIANALHSVAKEHIVTTADEIYDNSREQYQTEVNEAVGRYIENPEFINIKLDAEGKIIEAIQKDGTKLFGAGVKINGDLDFNGAQTKVIENPEFAIVWLDSADKILFGIQRDGNFYFGAGVPQQVISYIDEKISELSLDEYEQIVSFLGELINSGTLQELLNQKVDKEEGKSLIDAEYASGVYQIDSPEFIEVKLDEQERIIEATQKDGTKLFGAGIRVGEDLNVSGDIENKVATITTISNPEFASVWLDASNKILFGIQNDGNFLFGCGIPSQIVAYVESLIGPVDDKISALEQYMKETYGELIESPEWLRVITDAENKVIEGIKVDGTKEIDTDVTLNGSLNHQGIITEVTDNPEFLEAKVDAQGKLIEGINRNGEKVFGVIPPQIKQYIDENMPVGGSGIQSIEYDGATGDMYATYDDESGVTDVSMEPNGDIIVEYETGV